MAGKSSFSDDVVAIGLNAAIPVASEVGTVKQWYALPDGGNPENAAKAQHELTRILDNSPADIVADIGTVRGAPRYLDVPTQIQLTQQKLIDILTANKNSAHPRTVMIASLGDQWRRAHLHFFATNMTIDGRSRRNNRIRPHPCNRVHHRSRPAQHDHR